MCIYCMEKFKLIALLCTHVYWHVLYKVHPMKSVDPNDDENTTTVKYPYPTNTNNKWKPHYRYPNGSKKQTKIPICTYMVGQHRRLQLFGQPPPKVPGREKFRSILVRFSMDDIHLHPKESFSTGCPEITLCTMDPHHMYICKSANLQKKKKFRASLQICKSAKKS
jgi:hypothetical protein